MHAQILFNLSLDHWPATLLSLIPAILTLASAIYVYTRFPVYTISKVYFLFIFSLFMWQINDSFCRMSATRETAIAWYRLFAIGWMIQVPSSIHWVLLLTGMKKLAYNYSFLFMLYFSALFFAVPLCGGICSQSFSYSPFWNWVRTFNDPEAFQVFSLIWIFAGNLVNICLLGAFAYKKRNSPEAGFVSLFIFLSYLIMAVQGLVTEGYFPIVLKVNPIPISSTLMLTIILFTARRNTYKLFILSETIDVKNVRGVIQELIFLVSSQYNITYLNPYGENVINTKQSSTKTIEEIFSFSEIALNKFKNQVIIPAFQKKVPGYFRFSMENNVHWHIATYPIMKCTKTNGLLVICKDTTDGIQIADARLAALRSQMNPHFIFNSLNSIQHYIHSDQKENAELFLSIFANLIRQTLENSAKTEIPLSDELHTIQLYLKLEKARFGNRLSYEILPEENIDMENFLVPSMLVQPYIENAIIHGLAPKADGGKVRIYLKHTADYIIFTIEDDGVGREKSIAFQSRKLPQKKSEGMSITKARLKILNEQLKIPVSVKVKSLLNDLNEACGTQVEIYIPVNERF